MQTKNRIISIVSVIVMLISMMSFFVFPSAISASAETFPGDVMVSTGLTDATSFKKMSETGAQAIIDLVTSEYSLKRSVTDEEAKAATKEESATEAERSSFTATANVSKFWLTPYSGYRFKMKAGNYQISNVADMNLLAELSYCGVDFSEAVFYQSADLDFNFEEFRGISCGHSMIGEIANNYVTTYENGVSVKNYTEAIRPANSVRPFNGTFDGNGFVIKNLYIMANETPFVGVFGWTNNAVIKNVGIANGLIAGQESTGSIAGEAARTKLYNCWNAATVWGGGENGTGGLVGRLVNGESRIYNSYNLGMVFQYRAEAGGIVGWMNGGIIHNSYNWGQVICGVNDTSTTSATVYNAFVRKDPKTNQTGLNNYYRLGCGPMGSNADYVKLVNSSAKTDNALGVEASAVASMVGNDGLNKNINQSVTGWTVSYTDIGVGYPVLTYTKDSQTIRRVAQTDRIGEKHWATLENSDLMKLVYDIDTARKGVGTALNDIEVASANDLFVLAMLTTFQEKMPFKSIKLTADIDMDTEFTLVPGLKTYVPLYSGYKDSENYNSAHACTPDISAAEGGGLITPVGDGAYGLYGGGLLGPVAAMTIPFDGQYHEVKNWNTYQMGRYCSRGGSFICQTAKGAIIKNLGLIDVYAKYNSTQTTDRYISYALDPSTGALVEGNTGTFGVRQLTYNYASLLVGMGHGVIMENCFTTGKIETLNTISITTNNDSGIVARTWSEGGSIQDCWTDCVIDHINYAPKRVRAIGSSYYENSHTDVLAADAAWEGTPSELPSGYVIYNNVYYIGDSEPGYDGVAMDGAAITDSRNPVNELPYLFADKVAGTGNQKYKIDLAYFLNYQMKQKFMFTYDRTDGTIHFAEPLKNDEGEYVVDEETGFVQFSNPTRKVIYGLTSPAAAGGDLICSLNYQYYNGGETVSRLNVSAVDGYAESADATTLPSTNIMPYAFDPIVAFAAVSNKTAFDTLLTYYATLDRCKNMDIYENSTTHRYVYQMAKNINAISDESDRTARIDEMLHVILTYKKEASLEINEKYLYPKYPYYLYYELRSDRGGVFWMFRDEYAIYDEYDWQMAVEDSKITNFKGVTLHVINDIVVPESMNIIPFSPVHPDHTTNDFVGTIDGHGHTIEVTMNMTATDSKTGAGLIATAGSGAIIQNLGVKGAITLTLDTGAGDPSAAAGLVTYASGATIRGCWNEADVTVKQGTNTTFEDVSVGGISARGNGNTVIHNCYNNGTITGIRHAAAFNDWARDSGRVYNCFNTGEIIANGSTSLVRYRTDEAETEQTPLFGNLYTTVVPGNMVSTLVSRNGTAFTTAMTNVSSVDPSTYYDGSLAYILNDRDAQYKDTYHFTLSKGTGVSGDTTVLGTADNMVRKITVGSTVYYRRTGDVFTLPTGKTYKSGNYYATGSFIVPATDVTLTEVTGVDLSEYINLYTYWYMKNASYFDTVTYAGLGTGDFQDLIDNLTSAYNKGLIKLATMQGLDTDALTATKGKYKAGDAGMPHARLVQYHQDAPIGYRIQSADDLHAVSVSVALFNTARSNGKETLIKLQKDINMKVLAADQFFIEGLDATFDGNGKTISYFTYEQIEKFDEVKDGTTVVEEEINPGIFSFYKGEKISDLTVDHLLVSGGYAAGGLISNSNGGFTLENVTVRNSRVRKATIANTDVHCMGVLIGRLAGGNSVTIKDCVVEDSYLDYTLYEKKSLGSELINMGFIVGQTYASMNLDGVVSQRNTIILNGKERTKSGSVGYLIGESYNGSTESITIRNTTVYDCNMMTDPLVTEEADMLYGLAANTVGEGGNTYKYGEVIGYMKEYGTLYFDNCQIAGNDANASSSRIPLLVSVGQEGSQLVNLNSNRIYWDKNSNPATQLWYMDYDGAHATVSNAKPHNYEETAFFKYGRSGWEANAEVTAAVSSHPDLRQWTVIHSDTYRDTKDLADLPYPSLVKSGEEPIHQLYFSDVVGTNSDWDNIDRYSDSAKMLIVTVDELDNPDAEINNIPWDGCIGSMKDYVPENLDGDITINSVIAQYSYNSLSLDTDIAVNFLVQIHPDFRDAAKYKLTTTHSLSWKDSFTILDNGDIENKESKKVLNKEDSKYYYQIKLPLNANEMWRSFWVQLTDVGSNDTATYISRSGNVQTADQKYTDHSNAGFIKNYVQVILQNKENREDYAAAQNLAAALLNYGNEVRDCFWLGGNDRPWIDELKDYGYPLYDYTNMEDNDFTDKKVTTNYKETFTPYKSKGSKKNDSLAYVGSSLIFDTNVGIRHYFKLNGTATAEGVAALNAAYEAAVRSSDGTLIKDLEYLYSAEQKMYYVEYEDIAAQDLDEMFLFTFSKGAYDATNNYVVKLNYGVFSYGHMTWNKMMEEKFVTAALYEYWKAAEEYLEAVV